MNKETLSFVTPPPSAEKLQNFFGVFLQFQIGVDMDKTSDQGVRLDWYMAEEGNPGGWKVEECYILEQMRDVAAIPNLTSTEQGDGTVCYFFGDTCIRVRESLEDGKIHLEPVRGDQTACGEWVELPVDRVYGYCTLLERHLNRKEGR